MADPVQVYAATLAEVQRQTQLARSSSSGSEADASTRGGSVADSESGSGWVVLESGTTPAQLPGAEGCTLWPQQQWQIAYEILFCQCPPEVAALRPHQADDMLFFVYSDEAAAAARTRLFVRRRQSKAAALPPDLRPPAAVPAGGGGGSGGTVVSATGSGSPPGSRAAQVDWRASVHLMVVLQTAYRLSLVTAGDAELLNALVEDGRDGAAPGAPGGSASGGSLDASVAARVRQVTEVVHASPSRVPVNLDRSRSDAGRPQTSYPDISFSLDSCDHTLHAQVLRRPEDCYCVLLHADVASSWRMPTAPSGSAAGSSAADAGAAAAATAGIAALSLAGGGLASRHSSSGSVGSAARQAPQAALLFSGYVSHQQLTAALGSQLAGDPVRQVLRAAAAAARSPQRGEAQRQAGALATCRVNMRGPGGRGCADVAVSSFPPVGDSGHLPSAASAAAMEPAAAGGSGGPRGLLGRAQQLARGVAAAAKSVAAQAAGSAPPGEVDVGRLHLECSLMSLQVPVDMLADSILRAL